MAGDPTIRALCARVENRGFPTPFLKESVIHSYFAEVFFRPWMVLRMRKGTFPVMGPRARDGSVTQAGLEWSTTCRHVHGVLERNVALGSRGILIPWEHSRSCEP